MRIEILVGFAVGAGYGCLVALRDMSTKHGREFLLRHLEEFPSLPQLLIMYTALTVVSAVTYPEYRQDLFTIFPATLMGVESILLLTAKRIKDGLV